MQRVGVSCASAGNCTQPGPTRTAPVTLGVRGQPGRRYLGQGREVPGTAALNAGINWLLCAPAGNCRAAAPYTDSSGHEQAFVVNETYGASPQPDKPCPVWLMR